MDNKPRSPFVPALVAVALIAVLAWSLARHHWRTEELIAENSKTDGREALAVAAQNARTNALTAEARRAAFKEQQIGRAHV